MKNYGLSDRLIGWSDNNQLKWGRTYQDSGLRITSPERILIEYGTDVDVIVSSSAYDIIKDKLHGIGISDDHIRLYNFAFMDLEYTDKAFIFDHINDFNRSFQRLADEKSRKIYTHLLNYKITKDEEYLQQLQQYVDDEEDQYFDSSLFDFSGDEVLLDIGAYTGDTLSSFVKHYSKWKKYFGFEADTHIFQVLRQSIEHSVFQNKCRIYNCAAWNKQTTLFFDENPGSSTVVRNSSNMVQAEKIDTVLEGEEPFTIVKMDIEGAEANALLGAKNLIKKYNPVLAICVYHKRDDYFYLLDLIDEYCPGEYSYYFRQYRYTPTETVCYAIPHSRTKKGN